MSSSVRDSSVKKSRSVGEHWQTTRPATHSILHHRTPADNNESKGKTWGASAMTETEEKKIHEAALKFADLQRRMPEASCYSSEKIVAFKAGAKFAMCNIALRLEDLEITVRQEKA